MKKLVVLLMIIVSMFAFAACFGLEDNPPNNPPDDTPNGDVVKYEVTYSDARLDENSIGSVWVTAIAEVENTGNTDLYLSSGSIDLEDESGKLIKVLNSVSVYPQIISPGEKAYYFEATTVTGVTAGTKLNVVLHSDIVKSKREKIRFSITDVTVSNETYGGIKAEGRVENTSDKDESLLYIAVVAFDKNNKPLCVLTDIPEIKADEKKGFSASTLYLPKDITAASVSKTTAFGYPYQFQF